MLQHGHPQAPGLMRIYKTPDQPPPSYENAWHTDVSWREDPTKVCVLRCVECPETGGDTLWANMVLAYENLPGTVQAEIAGLVASHSYEAIRWRWQRNSVAIWDNRATQHSAVRDYPPCVRKMDRAGVLGEKPY